MDANVSKTFLLGQEILKDIFAKINTAGLSRTEQECLKSYLIYYLIFDIRAGFEADLENQANSDSEVKRGRWVEPKDIVCYKCSECGKYSNQEYGTEKPNFYPRCPHCGAYMET